MPTPRFTVQIARQAGLDAQRAARSADGELPATSSANPPQDTLRPEIIEALTISPTKPPRIATVATANAPHHPLVVRLERFRRISEATILPLGLGSLPAQV